MSAAIVTVSIAAIVFIIYLIITKFKQAFDDADVHQKQIIKDLVEVTHDPHPTPQQLVDFFNRPHP